MRHKSVRTAVGIALVVVMFNAALLVSMGSASPAAPPTPGQPSNPARQPRRELLVVHIPFHSTAERDKLATEWAVDESDTRSGYLTATTDRIGYNKMKVAGLAVTIDEQDTAQANNPTLFGNKGADPLTFDGGYKTVEEMIAFLDAEVAAHPGLAEKVDIGNTWCKDHPGTCVAGGANNGYDMWALHITNQAIAGAKPVFWYDGGIHSREIAVSEVAMRYADYLLANYDIDADAHWLVDYNDIWVVPMLNEDGHHLVEQGGNNPYLQRKNADNLLCSTYPPGSGQLGIDLNRNYDYTWGCCGGSSGSPCSEVFRGPSAASESETQYVKAKIETLIADQNGAGTGYTNTLAAPITTTGVVMGMHSAANLNLYAWGTTTNPAPNYNELDNMASHMSALNAYPQGNNYEPCAPPVCLYAVDGDSIDWAYGKLGAASFTTELGGSGFFPTYSYTQNTLWPENRGPLLYLAKIARSPYLTTRGPDASAVVVTPPDVPPGIGANLAATLNTNWTGNNYPQNVAAGEYYVDTPPWAGGTAVPMNGNFSGTTVPVTATIDTTSLSLGRHIALVRGRGVNDYSGYQSWGPITAAFFTVTSVLTTPTPLPTVTATPLLPTITPALPTITPLPTDTPPLPTITLTPLLTLTPQATDTPGLTGTPATPTSTPTDCPIPFVDINGNTFYTAIKFLYCRGIVNGTDATHYSPAGTATRAQFAKVVVLGFNIPSYTPTVPDFTDVPPTYFAYAFIEAGYHAGILSGFDSASCIAAGAVPPCYLPNRAITRAQLTKLVVNAAGYAPYTPTTQTFSDVGPSNVFYASIETAHYHAVINGYPDNTFRPNNNIRRDEMAQIVYKAITTP